MWLEPRLAFSTSLPRASTVSVKLSEIMSLKHGQLNLYVLEDRPECEIKTYSMSCQFPHLYQHRCSPL